MENPYEGITYTLTDEVGWPVTAPAPAHSAKVHGPRRARSRKLGYLAIRSIQGDSRPVDIADHLESDEIVLPVGSTLAYRFAVEQRLSVHDQPQVEPITPGSYHLKVLLSLRWREDGRRRNLSLGSDEVIVDLAAAPA